MFPFSYKGNFNEMWFVDISMGTLSHCRIGLIFVTEKYINYWAYSFGSCEKPCTWKRYEGNFKKFTYRWINDSSGGIYCLEDIVRNNTQ